MNNFKGIICITLLVVSVASTGCSAETVGRQEINSGGKKITILSTKAPVQTEDKTFANNINDINIAKIDKYAGIRGEEFLSNESILITKENLELGPIAVLNQVSNIRNLYSYNLESGEQKSTFKKAEFIWMPIISLDIKYIFSENLKPGKNSGLILDLDGNVKATVEDDASKGFHISFNNAK